MERTAEEKLQDIKAAIARFDDKISQIDSFSISIFDEIFLFIKTVKNIVSGGDNEVLPKS